MREKYRDFLRKRNAIPQLHGTSQAAQLLLLERGAARVAEQQQGLP
jgi:hypothetical protein